MSANDAGFGTANGGVRFVWKTTKGPASSAGWASVPQGKAYAESQRRLFGQAEDALAVPNVAREIDQDVAQRRGQRDAGEAADEVGVGELAAFQVVSEESLGVKRDEGLQAPPAEPAQVQIRAQARRVARAVGEEPHDDEALDEQPVARAVAERAVDDDVVADERLVSDIATRIATVRARVVLALVAVAERGFQLARRA